MDAVEAVARALVRSRGGTVTSTDEWWPGAVAHYLEMCAKWPDYQDARSLVNDAFRDAQAALSAARPFVAAECAKVAENTRDAWAKCGDGLAVRAHVAAAETIASAIKETIR